ncbi:MAG: hypothetical protein H7Y10_07780 [Flavobacterium sp.]|nr:hypothetical protein [Flavobacterium sp.]
MNIINSARTKTSTTRFDVLTLVENGLVFNYGKNGEKEIAFTELDMVYMKTHSLHPVIELVLILVPFLLVLLSAQYIPFDIMIIVAVVTIIPTFIKVMNYKWYSLKIRLKDGSIYIKKVSLEVKIDYLNIINQVQKECFYRNANIMASA